MQKKSRKRWFMIGGGIVVIAIVAGVIGVPRLTASAQQGTATTYQTQAAGLGSITSFVGATGNIRTNQSITINWQTSGIISKINVTPGQVVQAGTVLAQLDPTSLPQSVLNAQNALATDQQALDNLLNSNVARANAEVALITDEQNLVNAQKAAQSKLFQHASQTTIEVAQANLIQAQSALDNASTIYNRNKNRSSTDVQYAAALSQFAAAQQKFDQAQMNLNYAQSLPDPLSVQLANANVDLAQANYLDAKRTWESLKDGPNPVDVAAAQAKVAADQAIIDAASPTTPIAGTVTVVNNKPGDLVASNTAAFEIDDMTQMFVDVSVSEVDINKVQIGQKVDLTFDAIPNQTYPGTVTSIADVGTIANSVVNYNVTVKLMQNDPQVKPGMTSSANITIPGPQNVLVVPNRALRTVNGRQIVYIMNNGKIAPIPVVLGATSTTESQVTGGPLRQGELIVLNPPSTPTTTTQSAGGLGIFGRLFGGGGVRVAAGGGNAGFNRGGTGGTTGGTNRTGGGTTGGNTGGGFQRPGGGD